MALDCHENSRADGISVEAWSGIDTQKFCDIYPGTPVRHMVKVGNWKMYPLVIRCDGTIDDTQKAKFMLAGQASAVVNDSQWKGKKRIEDGDDYTFQDVNIVSVSYGEAYIDARVYGKWLQEYTEVDEKVTIKVNT